MDLVSIGYNCKYKIIRPSCPLRQWYGPYCPNGALA
jgi:hypothetical protein